MFINRPSFPMQSRNYAIYFILLYLACVITTPQNRFPILGHIHFEKILIFFSWVILIWSNKTTLRFSRTTILVLLFYFWMIISYFLSPYRNYVFSMLWFQDYWKFLILYFLILFSINDTKDLYCIFTGLVIILFLYQLLAWKDFLHGGSYIWQAGVTRIIGAWHPRGVEDLTGAGNYFGMITLHSLPFALFWYGMSDNKKTKMMLVVFFIMSFFSIAYSATRGAMLGFLFLILINIRSWRGFKIAAFVLIIISSIAVWKFPDYLKYRYLGMISEKTYGMDDRFVEVQEKSAFARLRGIKDGWALAKERPIFGHGPGSSPLTRKTVNEEAAKNPEKEYQMHTLYGQLLAETGFLGTFLFLSIIFVYFCEFRRIRNLSTKNSLLYNYKLALQNSMMLLLFYGIASHTLFRYHWFLLFACHGAFLDILSKNLKQKADSTDLTASTRQSLETS